MNVSLHTAFAQADVAFRICADFIDGSLWDDLPMMTAEEVVAGYVDTLYPEVVPPLTQAVLTLRVADLLAGVTLGMKVAEVEVVSAPVVVAEPDADDEVDTTEADAAVVAALLAGIPGSEITSTGGGCEAIFVPSDRREDVLVSDGDSGLNFTATGQIYVGWKELSGKTGGTTFSVTELDQAIAYTDWLARVEWAR